MPSTVANKLRELKSSSSKENVIGDRTDSREGEESPGCGTPFIELFDPDCCQDSLEAAKALFEMVIKPCPVDKFFSYVSHYNYKIVFFLFCLMLFQRYLGKETCFVEKEFVFL